MTFFAILGFIVYVLFCFELGKFIGFAWDAWRGVEVVTAVTRQADSAMLDLETLVRMATYRPRKGGAT